MVPGGRIFFVTKVWEEAINVGGSDGNDDT